MSLFKTHMSDKIKMTQTFIATLSPMLVMFLCIIIGFVLKKKNMLPDNADKTMSKIENYVCVPALAFSTFAVNCTVDSISKYYNIILYSAVAVVLAIVIAVPLSKVFVKDDAYRRNIYKYALTFANFGFMGNAIVPAILNGTPLAQNAGVQDMLYIYLLFTIPLYSVCYTWGIYILIPKGENKGSLLKNLANPIFIAIFAGAIVGLCGVGDKIPAFIMDTVNSCKACMAPLAMILTGFVIGSYDFKTLLNDKKVYVATFLRLFVIPVVILGVLMALGADELVLTFALFGYATPLGLNTVVFPAAYGSDAKTGASMAMISHTLSVVTIPLMYALLKVVLQLAA